MTGPFRLLQDLLQLHSFRVLLFGTDHLEQPVRCPVFLARSVTPEHRQVQVVVSAGASDDAIRRLGTRLFPLLFDGLTIRDLRTGQAIVPLGEVTQLANTVSDLLLPDVTVHIFGKDSAGSCEESHLEARLLYRLPDGSGGFEESVIGPISDPGLAPEAAAEEILDHLCLIIENQAAGERLRPLLEKRRK
jgi:ethanolamine ammonia-lyase small subunit